MAETEKSKTPTFLKAPIVEAVFDIKVELAGPSDPNQWEVIYQEIKSDFPTRQIKNHFEAKFNLEGKEPVTENENKQVGLILRSNDNTKIVQVGEGGFSFHKLKPYSTWDDFSAEAMKLWALYKKKVSPKLIIRVGLRYVNVISVIASRDLKDYFLTAPEIAKSLPQAMSEYLLRIALEDPASGGTAIIHQTIDPRGFDGKNIPIVFDIDAFKNVSIPADDPSLSEILNGLRSYKNRIFLESLTEETKSMFN